MQFCHVGMEKVTPSQGKEEHKAEQVTWAGRKMSLLMRKTYVVNVVLTDVSSKPAYKACFLIQHFKLAGCFN